ncbi:MAG: radical SAM protein [Lachnospiraceae bacterium]|nr:radical SAM protein [Lachnospiraceae bacterium]
MKKILFGAGLLGVSAVGEYGRESIAYFADNNRKKIGTCLEGIEIIGWDELLRIHADYEVIITTKYRETVEEQLKAAGIKYRHYYENKKDVMSFKTKALVVNPYEGGRENDTFWENSDDAIQLKINEVERQTNRLYSTDKLKIQYIEIETVNRCNGGCGFCPVNRFCDPREYAEMPDELFTKIIDELAEMDYDGRLALYSNDEPFLDRKIIERHRYARAKVPNANMYLFTNGTLLTLDKFINVMECLDELIIDNYHQELKLIKPCQEIAAYCERHPEYKERVTIVLRKPQEQLSSRGGDSPNRKQDLKTYPMAKCTLPFKQLVIRPTGEVSLCCNDALGKYTLGDLKVQTIAEVWNGEKYKDIREAVYKGRSTIEQCKYCDAFFV